MATSRDDIFDPTGQRSNVPGRGFTRGYGFGKAYFAGTNSIGSIPGNPITGETGWAPGALFINPITTVIGNFLWLNVGTGTSAVWLNLDANANLDLSLVVRGVGAGYKVARGVTALDGTNPTPVTTGLATVVAATVTLEGAVAPGVGTSLLTIASTNYATGALSVNAWKVTSTSDTTLVASTGTENFEWVAVGT